MYELLRNYDYNHHSFDDTLTISINSIPYFVLLHTNLLHTLLQQTHKQLRIMQCTHVQALATALLIWFYSLRLIFACSIQAIRFSSNKINQSNQCVCANEVIAYNVCYIDKQWSPNMSKREQKLIWNRKLNIHMWNYIRMCDVYTPIRIRLCCDFRQLPTVSCLMNDNKICSVSTHTLKHKIDSIAEHTKHNKSIYSIPLFGIVCSTKQETTKKILKHHSPSCSPTKKK